jgi:hypothetical protein
MIPPIHHQIQEFSWEPSYNPDNSKISIIRLFLNPLFGVVWNVHCASFARKETDSRDIHIHDVS